jgi:hypothetical protein
LRIKIAAIPGLRSLLTPFLLPSTLLGNFGITGTDISGCESLKMLGPILVTALVVLGSYLIRKIRWARFEQFKNIPHIKNDGIWGHLKLMGELMSSGREGAHPGTVSRSSVGSTNTCSHY